jgi:GTPase
MIGPIDGTFHEVIVKSIHDNYKTLIDNLSAGCSGCICIKSTEKRLNLKKSLIRRGMLVISKNHNKFTTDKFQAKVKILHHPTTIKKNYESIIHCGSIRQTAKIIEIDKDLLRTGDQSIVTFQFKSRPEFVQLNKQIMFREGKTKGIGVVTQIL